MERKLFSRLISSEIILSKIILSNINTYNLVISFVNLVKIIFSLYFS